MDEEEDKMNSKLNIENEKKTEEYSEPLDDDQSRKKEKFKSYLFSQAQNITTPELLSQIVNIIQGSYLDEIKIRNEIANYENSVDETNLNLNELNGLDDLKIKMKHNEIAMLAEKNKTQIEPEYIIDEKGNKKYKY